MANSKSAKKRIKTTAIRTVRNAAQKNKMRTFIKKLEVAILDKNLEECKTAFSKAMSEIAKTAQKGIIKKNTASRMISRLNAKVKALVS